MDVLVIGAGVVGLNTALRLREAGHTVRIWASRTTPDTTSDIPAALWYPYLAAPEDRVRAWGLETLRELERLAAIPGAGVRWRAGFELCRSPRAAPAWSHAVPEFRPLAARELPAGYPHGFAFRAPVVEMPIYMPWLTARVRSAGVAIERRTLDSLAPALEACRVVVNCSGLGARELVPDPSLTPVRGQILRVAQIGLEHFWLDDNDPLLLTYIVPRSNDVILGGTAERGVEDAVADEATTAAILERCTRLEPRLRAAPVLARRAGLRPARPEVRLDVEPRDGHRFVVHHYGHGGSGVTLAWGGAGEVVERIAELASGERPRN